LPATKPTARSKSIPEFIRLTIIENQKKEKKNLNKSTSGRVFLITPERGYTTFVEFSGPVFLGSKNGDFLLFFNFFFN
jgi:hypothetical protein